MRNQRFGALIGCLLAAAQPAFGQPATTYRIGYLSPESQADARPTFDAFRNALRSLGYTEGRNVSIDARWGEGSVERLDRDAAELTQSKPDVIVAQTLAAFAVRRASSL